MSNTTLAQSQQKAAHHKKIRTGRGWILAVTILQFLGAGFFYFLMVNAGDPEVESGLKVVTATIFFVGVIFLGCWVWAKRQPFPAALTALVVFITVHAGDAILDPSSLRNGIVLKIFFLIGLSQAVSSAYKVRKSHGPQEL